MRLYFDMYSSFGALMNVSRTFDEAGVIEIGL